MTWEEEIEVRIKREAIAKDELDKFQSCLRLAGFTVTRHHELVNGYHGWSQDIWKPWYLFETDVGLIKIGWRKRVINVDWTSTGINWVRPTDANVTAAETYFHAYGYLKLAEYLALLHQALVKP